MCITYCTAEIFTMQEKKVEKEEKIEVGNLIVSFSPSSFAIKINLVDQFSNNFSLPMRRTNSNHAHIHTYAMHFFFNGKNE